MTENENNEDWKEGKWWIEIGDFRISMTEFVAGFLLGALLVWIL